MVTSRGMSLISVGAGSVTVSDGVAVGDGVALGVAVGVDVAVGVSVGVAVAVAVSVGVSVAVGVGVSVGVAVKVAVGVKVWVGVDVGRVGTIAPRSVGVGGVFPLQALITKAAMTTSGRFFGLTAALRSSGATRAFGVSHLYSIVIRIG
jgi:hypothetical protein